jgi:regulator of protease activity HflC (stomatin/prohibitin superfamily)
VIIVIPAALFGTQALRQSVEKGHVPSEDLHWLWRIVRLGVPAAALLIWVVVTISASFHQVPAGHVGVVYEFGSIVGQTGDGLQIVPPWRNVRDATVQLQTLCFIDDATKCPDGATTVGEGLDSFSKETQNVFIDAIVNIEVSPDEVQGLYRSVGPNYINKLVPGRIAQIFKDETVNYAAVDLAPSREQIRANVEAQLRTELAPYSIDVKALLIENIAFESEFEQAITAKQVAAQEALRQQELVASERAKADQRIEQARGEGESLRVTAQGQADANNLISQSLTPSLIQFQAVQKLADNVQIALIPSGQGVIIDPTTILSQQQETSP